MKTFDGFDHFAIICKYVLCCSDRLKKVENIKWSVLVLIQSTKVDIWNTKYVIRMQKDETNL